MIRAALVVAAAGWAGCAGPVRSQASAVRDTIKQARDQGAYRCAPRELAIAESHVEFVEAELSGGNYYRAKEELAVARKNAALAVQKSPIEQILNSKSTQTILGGVIRGIFGTGRR